MGSRSVRFFYDQLLVKEPMTPTATPWHQDLPYWPLTGDDILSLWIGCDTISAEAGAMRYLKGSHRAGMMYAPRAFDPASGFDDIYRQAGLPPLPAAEDLLERFEVLTCAVEPGDVIAHHPLTIHGSPGNALRTVRRRALALRYVGDDARFSRRPGAFLDDPQVRGLLPEPIALEDGEPLDGANFPTIAFED
jgi:ectoine hydroxylase-related dioxygenase (phytanoyl-CoA dioxygenase family)